MKKMSFLFLIQVMIQPVLATSLTDVTEWSESEAWEHCTKGHPCYYDGSSWLPATQVSASNGWNSYTAVSFSIDIVTALGISIAVPLIHNGINRTLDYLAYKFQWWSGLKDGGGVEQTKQLSRINDSVVVVGNRIGAVGNELETLRSILLSADEKRQQHEGILDALQQGNAKHHQVAQNLGALQGALSATAQTLNKTGKDLTDAVQKFGVSQEKMQKLYDKRLAETEANTRRLAMLVEAMIKDKDSED